MWDVIVVGVALRDDDEAVLTLARELARTTGARLALVHAYPSQPLIAVPPPASERELEAEAVAQLEAMALRLCEATEVTTHAKASPSPVRALREGAEELGASAIVIGASHRGPLGRVAPGGVGERLLHAAPCAVALAPRGYQAAPLDLRRIGVAYAGGPEAATSLGTAVGLATRAGGTVRMLTVLEPLQSPILSERDWAIPPDLERVRRDKAGALLEIAGAAVPAEVPHETVLLEGRPPAELAAASADLDLLICGTRGYGPVHSLVVGGVSSTLCHTAACPLLVVPRPADGARRSAVGSPHAA
jgi:nucleotide-binding universal stress UspA family protein